MRTLVLMAKAPRPGVSKTRLVAAGGLDADQAARLADAFLRDTVRAMRAVRDAERLLWYAPPDAEAYFRALDPEARLVPQPELGFGARMAAAFELALDADAARVVLLGSDTPQLEPARIEQAFAALDDVDVVLGPSLDGGYYLLGLRRPCPRLFEQVDWSTERVRGQTLARAAEAGCSVHELEAELDVDEPADLDRLRRLCAGGSSERCPHTARALAEL